MKNITKHSSLRPAQGQRGLTLIELVVVMAILIVLAAIVLGNFPDLLNRATTSTSASNLSDLTRIIHIENALTQKFPNGYDSLHTAATTLDPRLPALGTPAVVTSVAPTAAEVTALSTVGILKVYNHATNPADATFFSPIEGVSVPIAPSQNLALVSGGALSNNSISVPSGARVFAVGLGSYLSIVGPGKRLQDAPLYTAHNVKPSENYSRPVALFQVTTGATTDVKYLGAFGIDGGSLKSLSTRMQEYSSITQ